MIKKSKEATLNTSNNKLKRNLTLFEATMHSIAFVVGTGIFMKPAVVLLDAGSTGMAMLIWFAGGMISLCSALTIAEIAAYIPKVGGMYAYIVELYGDFVGYIYGWIYMLISGPGGAAAAAMAFATFSSYFIEMNLTQLRILSIAAMIFCAVIQGISTKLSMQLQAIGTIAKLIPILAIVAVGLFKGDIPGSVNFDLVGGSPAGGIAAALLGVLWSFDGWVSTCTLGEEMTRPEKNLPKAIILSLTFVTALYMLFNYVVFKTASTEQIVASADSSIGTDVAEMLFGPAGAVLVAISMMISGITSLNAQIVPPARYLLAMANKRQVIGSEFLCKLNPKFNTPTHCLVVVLVIASIYILSGTFNSVTNFVIFIIWTFFILCILGIFKLRKKFPHDDSLYHVPLYPIVPLLGVAGAAFLVISTIIDSPSSALLGIAIGLVGLPMLYYCKKKYGTDHNISGDDAE